MNYIFSLIKNVARFLFGFNNPRHASLLWILAIGAEKKLSLVDAVDALVDESSGEWSVMVEDLVGLLRQGTPLTEAISAIPGLLPDESVLAIRIGAESGTLIEVLKSEAQRLSDDSEFVDGGGFSIMYAIAVLFVMFAIVSFICVYIIPKFKRIFLDFGVELPRITQTLIDTGDWIVQYGALLFPLSTLAGFCGLWIYSRHFSQGTLSSPWVRLFPRMSSGPILRALSFVMDSGRPLAPAIESMSNHHPSQNIYHKLNDVAETTAAGGDCWDCLQHHGLLKRHEVEIVHAAEKAGNAGWALRHLAGNIERSQKTRFNGAAQLFEPAVVLLLGALTAWIVISLFMPLIKLLNDLS